MPNYERGWIETFCILLIALGLAGASWAETVLNTAGLATLEVPHTVELLSPIGQRVEGPAADDAFAVKRFECDPGLHRITVRYQEGWLVGESDEETIVSEPVRVLLDLAGEATYRISPPFLVDLDRAREYARAPTFILETGNDVIPVAIIPPGPNDVFGEALAETPQVRTDVESVAAPVIEEARAEPIEPEIVAVEREETVLVEPIELDVPPAVLAEVAMIEAEMAEEEVAAPITVEPGIRGSVDPVEMAKYWWEQADEPGKEAILLWITDQR